MQYSVNTDVTLVERTADPVPEPSTLFLLAAGIIGAVSMSKPVRKRRDIK